MRDEGVASRFGDGTTDGVSLARGEVTSAIARRTELA
jgi:hypothetical protein